MTLDEGSKVIFEVFGQSSAWNNHCFCALTGRGTNLGQNPKRPKPLPGRVFGKNPGWTSHCFRRIAGHGRKLNKTNLAEKRGRNQVARHFGR